MLRVCKLEPAIGQLVGNHVIVDDLKLHDFDYYGKGEMSRSKPAFETWFDSTAPISDGSVVGGFPREKLILSLQEAFYLCYALGSLRIHVKDQAKNIQECFELFCNIEGAEFFIARYSVYHYFRCRGWITRSGSKYGCDYVLYSRGPEYEHAKYAVNIVSSKDLKEMTWKELQHNCRISVNVKKDLIICQYHLDMDKVDITRNVTDLLKSSISLATMKVTRFVPEKDREADND